MRQTTPERERMSGTDLSADPPRSAVVDSPAAYIPWDRRRRACDGHDASRAACAGRRSSRTSRASRPLTEALAERARLAARLRGADRASEPRLPCGDRRARPLRRRRHLLQRRRDHLLARRRRRLRARRRRPRDAGRDRAARARSRPRAASSFQLGLKVAVAVGPARRFVVGDPEIQLIDVLAGEPDRPHRRAPSSSRRRERWSSHAAPLAAARRSRQGRRAARGRQTARPSPSSSAARRRARRAARSHAAPPLPDELARPWLLPAVYERLSTGRGEFLAELRPAFPVLRQASAGSTTTPTSRRVEKLDEFVRAAQRILAGYGGNVLQLTLGDKGAYLYGVFGTPFAHEDDAARACAAALELSALEDSTAARDIRIGITHGRLRSGTYGHDRSPDVRLPGRRGQPLGQADVEGAARRDLRLRARCAAWPARGFTWTKLEPLRLKGKAGPVAAYALTGTSRGPLAASDALRAPDRRTQRRARPRSTAAPRRSGRRPGEHRRHLRRGRHGQVAADRRVRSRRARARGVLVAFGECQSFGTTHELLRLARDLADAARAARRAARAASRSRRSSRRCMDIDPALVARAPLLDAVLGLPIPDTELTSSFDAKLRKTSLENLLADCLRAHHAQRAAACSCSRTATGSTRSRATCST